MLVPSVDLVAALADHPEWKAWVDENIDALSLALPESTTVFGVGIRVDEMRTMCAMRAPLREDHARAVIAANLRLRELEGGVGYKFLPDHVDLVHSLYMENLAGGAATFSGEDNRP